MTVSLSKQSNKLGRNAINYKKISEEWVLKPNESEVSVQEGRGRWETVKCSQEVRSDYHYVSSMQEHYILWFPDNGDAAKTNKQNHHQQNFISMTHSPYLCGNSGHPSTGAAEDFTGARRLLASWRVSRRGVFCSQ